MTIELRSFRFSNSAQTVPAADFAADATELSVVDATNFPSVEPDGEFGIEAEKIFSVVLTNQSTGEFEVVYVTGVSGSTLTIERAKEGTTALDWEAANTVVTHTVTKGFFEQQEGGVGSTTAPVLTDPPIADVYDETAIYLSWSAAVAPGEDEVIAYDIYRDDDGYGFVLLDTVAADVVAYTDEDIYLPTVTGSIQYYVVARFAVNPSAQSNTATYGAVSATLFIVDQGGSGGDTERMAKSTDNGATWTLVDTPIDAQFVGLKDIAYSPTLGRLVVVGDNFLMTSDDLGVTWDVQTAISNAGWGNVAWSPTLELFVAIIGNDGTGGNTAAYSSDGISWTVGNTMPNSGNWTGLVWSSYHSMFIAVRRGTGTQKAAYSTNGTSWTAVTQGTEADDVAADDTNGVVCTSDPGAGNVRVTSDPTAGFSAGISAGAPRGVAYGNGQWVFSNTTSLVRTTDPSSVADTTEYSDAAVRLTRCYFCPEEDLGDAFIALTNVATTGGKRILRSLDDGDTWTEIDIPVKAVANNNWWSMCQVEAA